MKINVNTFSCASYFQNNCFLNQGGTGVLWWLYAKQRKSPKETVIPEQLQIAEDNLRALLIYAISATVFTVSMDLGQLSSRFVFLFTGIINEAETHLWLLRA